MSYTPLTVARTATHRHENEFAHEVTVVLSAPPSATFRTTFLGAMELSGPTHLRCRFEKEKIIATYVKTARIPVQPLPDGTPRYDEAVLEEEQVEWALRLLRTVVNSTNEQLASA